jgi:hypothetical protein
MSKKLTMATVAALALGSVTTANAQAMVFPDYAYDAMTAASLANTADEFCPDIEKSDKGMNKNLSAMIKKLMGDGVAPGDITPHFESEFAVEQLEARASAFREKHGIGPDNDAAFCEAIKAEAKDDRAFRKLIDVN